MKTIGTIRKDSPRAETWRAIFGGDEVPLRGPISGLAIAEGPVAEQVGSDPVRTYELDLRALTPEQRERLIVHCARQSGLSPEQVAAEMEQVGCPVLADDVIVGCDTPWFL